MKKESTFLSVNGLTDIHYIEWVPSGSIKAVLQIVHGMDDFIDRYDRFASFMSEHGFLVVGHDHLGHGLSVRNKDEYGYFFEGENKNLIGDIHQLRTMKQEEYKGLPYFVMGHSMGSFLTRMYIENYGEGLDACIIMGTGSQPITVLKTGQFLTSLISKFKGWKYRSKMINDMCLGAYNKHYKDPLTPFEWISKDRDVVDIYCQNPLNTFVFTVNGYHTLFSTIEYIQKEENINRIPKDLPIFFVSGDDDPVGDFGKGVKKAYVAMKDAGVRDIQLKLYPTDRHEILNEIDYLEVQNDLLSYLEKQL